MLYILKIALPVAQSARWILKEVGINMGAIKEYPYAKLKDTRGQDDRGAKNEEIGHSSTSHRPSGPRGTGSK